MDGLRLLRDVTGAEVDQSMGAVSFLMSFFSQAPAFIIIFIIERAITGTRLPGQSPPQKKFDLSGVQHQLGGRMDGRTAGNASKQTSCCDQRQKPTAVKIATLAE